MGRDPIEGSSSHLNRWGFTMILTGFDSHGFPIASGIFETIKTVDGLPIALGQHMRRALASGAELGIPIPSEDLIRAEIIRVLNENPHPIGRLRLCFSQELFHISHDSYTEQEGPARLNFHSKTMIGSIHKRFPYDDRFALIEAANDEGFHDSILFNAANEITETAVSNLVFLIAGEWFTPPITSGILPGVIRAIAIEKCGVKVRSIHISEIPEIESGFVISSLRVAQPISHIGEMRLKIGDASRALEEQIRANCTPASVG
jgi:branched-subunit amino acid aminotransferase/4-amino-4-deoxychorismate lyase